MSVTSLPQLLSDRENARLSFVSAGTAVRRAVASHLSDEVAVLRECSRALHAIGHYADDFDDALDTIEAMSRELRGDESEVDDADD